MRPLFKVMFLLLCCVFLSPSFLQAEVVGYFKLGNIDGPVTEAPHEGWIAIHGFGQQMELVHGQASGQLSDPIIDPIRLTKFIDETSALLYKNLVSKTYNDEARLEFMNAAGLVCFSIVLKNVAIINIATSVGSTAGTEMVSLFFEEISWTTTRYDEDGSPNGEFTSGYNLLTHEVL